MSVNYDLYKEPNPDKDGKNCLTCTCGIER